MTAAGPRLTGVQVAEPTSLCDAWPTSSLRDKLCIITISPDTLQRQVLHLYRDVLRLARSKSPDQQEAVTTYARAEIERWVLLSATQPLR